MVDSFLSYLANEKRLSNHTYIAYETDLGQFADFLQSTFETESPEKASYREIRSWIVSLSEQELTNTTVNRKIATLKAYFGFLKRKGKIEVNPMVKIKSLKTPLRLPVFIAENAMETLLENDELFPQTYSGQRNYMILELLYGTGVRLDELINLKIQDVDLFGGKIKVLGKRNKQRIIPLHAGLRQKLLKYLALRREAFTEAEGFIFLTDKGSKLYPVFVQRLSKRFLGLISTQTKKSPHVLRHTFATHLLNKGAELNAIKELLGHSSLSATQIYTHNSIEQLKAIHSKAHPKAE